MKLNQPTQLGESHSVVSHHHHHQLWLNCDFAAVQKGGGGRREFFFYLTDKKRSLDRSVPLVNAAQPQEVSLFGPPPFFSLFPLLHDSNPKLCL